MLPLFLLLIKSFDMSWSSTPSCPTGWLSDLHPSLPWLESPALCTCSLIAKTLPCTQTSFRDSICFPQNSHLDLPPAPQHCRCTCLPGLLPRGTAPLHLTSRLGAGLRGLGDTVRGCRTGAPQIFASFRAPPWGPSLDAPSCPRALVPLPPGQVKSLVQALGTPPMTWS